MDNPHKLITNQSILSQPHKQLEKLDIESFEARESKLKTFSRTSTKYLLRQEMYFNFFDSSFYFINLFEIHDFILFILHKESYN